MPCFDWKIFFAWTIGKNMALLFSFIGYQDEILDIIQDNAPHLIKHSSDVMKRCITDIQALRKKYRDKDRELRFHLQEDEKSLENYEERYGKPYSTTINQIATYVNTIQRQIQDLDLSSSKEISSVNSQKSTFVAEEVARAIEYLTKIFAVTIKTVANDDLKLWKKQLHSHYPNFCVFFLFF